MASPGPSTKLSSLAPSGSSANLHARPLLVRQTSELIRRDSFGATPRKIVTTMVEIVEEQTFPCYIIEVFKTGGHRLKAGSLDGIIDWLLAKNYDDIRVLKAFLLCYRIMIAPKDLWDRVVYRFPFEQFLTPECKEEEAAREVVRRAVIEFILIWIETCPTEDFFSIEGKMAAPLWKQTQEFIKKLQINKYREFSVSLVEKIQSIAVPLQELQARAAKELAQEEQEEEARRTLFEDSSTLWSFSMGLYSYFGASAGTAIDDADSFAASRASRDNISVLDLRVEEILACLTHADFHLFQRVKMSELLLRTWETDKLRSRVAEITQRFDRIAFWVATEILNDELDLYKRKAVLEHMIFSAEKCFLMNNFNAAMAILAGLNNGAVSRLKLTWAELPYRSKGIFDKLDEFMSPLQNFKVYRELLSNARASNKPTFPYLALILRDITFAHENPNKLPNPAANTHATLSSAPGTPSHTTATVSVQSNTSSPSSLAVPSTPQKAAASASLSSPSTPQQQLNTSPSSSSGGTISPSASTDRIDDKFYNFNKIEILGKQIMDVKHFQSLPFTQLVDVDEVVQSYFRDLQLVTKEDELYQLSYKAEPRPSSSAVAPAPPTITT